MAEYKIIHKEEFVGWFYVNAEDESDALRKFSDAVDNAKIDFSDMEMVDSSDTAVLVGNSEEE